MVHEVPRSIHSGAVLLAHIKKSWFEIPFDKELAAYLSRKNLYETHGADPSCGGKL